VEKTLEDKIALVTGGTRGIGRAIAAKFAIEGATVILTSRSGDTARQAASEIAKQTGVSGDPMEQIEGVECDSTKSESCAQVVKSIVEKYGRIDILLNNAGVTNDKLILRMSDEDWKSVFETNLHGAFYFSRAAAKAMLRQHSGRIINISSVVGIMGQAGQTNYAATKAGLIGFSKSLARELGSRGITVNAIAPGFIETAMTEAMTEKMKETLQGQIPLGRLGKPDDVADAALFLASDAASYITGAVLQVDGGLGM